MNNTYILLRNNSESTPLSLEDLKRIGLLPTDLLWVECQSVCWQRPQEIPELKELLTEAIKSTTDETWDKYTPHAENKTSADTRKDDSTPLQQEGSTSEMKIADSINTPHSKSYLSINDTLLNEGVKDPWIQTRATKDKTELLGSLLKLPLKKIVLYAGLVAAGAGMMLIITGTSGNEPTRSQAGSQQQKTTTTTPVEELAQDSSATAETYDQKNTFHEQTTDLAAEEVISVPIKKETTAKHESTINKTTPLTNETPANYPAAVAEKKEVKKEPVEDIASKLQLKFNEYTVAAFGGIRDLKMTLQNNSPYLLDKVSVELRYLNLEGKLVRTETIDFNFVEPGAETTVAVKKSSRGVKLDYKITRIESKEFAATNSPAGENNQFSKN